MLGELGALLDLLKAKGVSRFSGPGSLLGDKDPLAFRVLVEFAPVVPPLDDKPGPKQPDPEVCGCGCAMYTHVNGLCTNGCDESKCGAA